MNNINVYTPYYIDKNIERNKELELCFSNNVNNKYINNFNMIKYKERLKYEDFIKIINNISLDEDINIICNSDIYFNDTIKYFLNIKKEQCYALSRWDLNNDGSISHYARADSQDVWAFKGKIKQNLKSDFYLGFRGCDNRFAHEIKEAGYQIINPSKTIQTIHVHQSNIRYYTHSDSLVPGPYLTLDPISL